MKKCVLKMEHITKQFGTFKANDDVSLDLHEGEVLTLLGENGAGKSTLMNVLCGLYRPTEGEIYIEDKRCKMHSPSDAVALGVGMVHQHFMLVEALTVFQNIILGMHRRHGIVIRESALRKEITDLSEQYGLDIDLDSKITEISVGAQQRVEIVKALWRGARILILDEPTAVLTDEETAGLFKIIRRLTSEGMSVLFISHKLKEVMEISDRIIVLRHGQKVGEYLPAETNEQELANKMVGRVVSAGTCRRQHVDTPPAIRLDRVSYRKESKHNGIHDITLNVRPGEILGVAGVDGNGQSELAQVLTGLLTPEEGTVFLDNEEVTRFDAQSFIEHGVAHIPEDRNKMGLVGDMSISENLALKNPPVKGMSNRSGWALHRGYMDKHATAAREKYDIRSRTNDQLVRQLSGGNQQKVILARELEQNPRILVAVHPTRGLDIGAALYVRDCIVEARDKGCAVVMISTDISELLQVSDRMIVMYEGHIQLHLDCTEFDMDRISLAVAGRDS